MSEKKAEWIKTTPSSENWKGMVVALPIPPVFSWRGEKYVASELTAQQIAQLASDKGFGHILAKTPETDKKVAN